MFILPCSASPDELLMSSHNPQDTGETFFAIANAPTATITTISPIEIPHFHSRYERYR